MESERINSLVRLKKGLDSRNPPKKTNQRTFSCSDAHWERIKGASRMMGYSSTSNMIYQELMTIVKESEEMEK